MSFGNVLDLQCFADLSARLNYQLSPCFGPCGLDRLVNSSDGALTIVNSGEDILKSQPVDHPVLKLMIESAITHRAKTGDNSKAFVVLLSSLLTKIARYERINRSSRVNFGVSMSRLLEKFWRCVFQPFVLPAIMEGCTNSLELDPERLKFAIRSLVNCRRLAESAIISEIIFEALCYNNPNIKSNSLRVRLDHMISALEDVCIESHDKPTEGSRIDKVLIVPRDYIIYHPLKNHQDVSQDVGFVLLKINEEHHTTDQIVVNGTQEAIRLLNFRSNLWKKMCDKLSFLGTKLLLSCAKISEDLKCWCSVNKISAIQCLPEESMNRLSKYFAIHPITSFYDVESDGGFQYIGSLRSFGTTTINGQNYACMEPSDSLLRKWESSDHLDVFPFQIIVCGLSRSISRQNKSVIKKTLKQLNSWLVPHKDTSWTCEMNRPLDDFPFDAGWCGDYDSGMRDKVLRVHLEGILMSSCGDNKLLNQDGSISYYGIHIPAYGAFEMAVNLALKRFLSLPMHVQKSHVSVDNKISEEHFAELREVCKIIMDMLIEVPLLLIKNSYAPNHSRLRTKVHLMDEMNRLTKSKESTEIKDSKSTLDCNKNDNSNLTRDLTRDAHEFITVNCRSGELKVMTNDCSHVEPLRGKVELLHDVLELCQQLLRLEAIIPIRNKPPGFQK